MTCSFRASVNSMHRCSDAEPYPPTTPPPPTEPRLARSGSAAVEAQFDHAGGDLAGAVAARVAADVEFRRQGGEPPLRGALGDVQLGGDLGARRGAAREGALGPVRRDERGGGR